MRKAHRLLGFCLLAAAAAVTAGCPKEPVRISMVLDAAVDVNPDPTGQALSVVVRIYQLKDKGRLESADYNAILKSEKETLADDMLQRQERQVEPGTQELLEIAADPMAKYIGVVALFRNPTGDLWRKIILVGKSKTQKIGITLREQVLEVTTGK